jgi:transposase
MGWYDRRERQTRDLPNGQMRIYLRFEIRRIFCRRCGAVKRERLDFLADNPFYTKRFAYYVGRRCRGSAIKEIAEELLLDWDTVKELDKQYMQAQLARAGTPGPKVIGIDEISIRKGHTIGSWSATCCVSARSGSAAKTASEASMDEFYGFLGKKKAKAVRLA